MYKYLKQTYTCFSFYLCGMEELLEKLDTYRKEIIDTEISGADAAEAYRIRFLGTKGIVKNLFQEMKNVPADKKKEFGQILNEFKQLAESKYESSKEPINDKRSTINDSCVHARTFSLSHKINYRKQAVSLKVFISINPKRT